jgi:hypothetical protein
MWQWLMRHRTLWRLWLRWGFPLPPVAGGEIDVGNDDLAGGEPGDPGGSGDAAVPGSGEADATPAEGSEGATGGAGLVAVDGQQLSEQEIREALASHRNRQSWERAYKRRDQAFAAARGALERAFGLPMQQWGAAELEDLQSFGVLNNRLRSDEGFRQVFFNFFGLVNQARSMSPEQVEGAVRQIVAGLTGGAAERGADRVGNAPAIPPEFDQRLGRIERAQVARALRETTRNLDGHLRTALQKHASDLTAKHGDLREEVLNFFDGRFSDADLVRMDQDGSLQDEVERYTRYVVAAHRHAAAEALKARGNAAAAAKRGVPPRPLGGGPPSAAPKESAPSMGRGLSAHHEKMRRAVLG